jgi:DNA repair exonuclease SbcCD ATPase subunit
MGLAHGSFCLINEVSGQMTEIAKTNGNGNSNVYDKFLPIGSIILALFGLFWSVANPRDDIKQIKQELQAEIDQIGRDKVTLAEHREYTVRKDKDTDRIDGEINTIRAGIVRRAEHEQHWAEELERINALRDQIVELRKQFTGSWDIGKQLDNLQKEIDDMRNYHVALAPRPGVATTP